MVPGTRRNNQLEQANEADQHKLPGHGASATQVQSVASYQAKNEERILRLLYASNFRSVKGGKFARFANTTAMSRCQKLTYYGLDDIQALRVHSLNASVDLQPATRDAEQVNQIDANALLRRKMAEQAAVDNEAEAKQEEMP